MHVVRHQVGNTVFRQALLATSMLFAAASASAQTLDASVDPAGTDTGEIIVTAQKRAQSTMNVGITLSVTSGDQIRERRIMDVSGLPQLASNVSVKENIPGMMPVITIRGVGLNDFSATNSPSAGVYVDDVYLTSLALMNFNFFDLARLEILKGPQGTLYGRNATAGAINIISAPPLLSKTEGRIGGTLGNYSSGDAEGMINLPIGETAALRVALKGIWQSHGFWYDTIKQQDFGDRKELLGRAQLLWQPSSDLKVTLKVEGQHTRSELGNAEFFGALPSPGATCPGSPACYNFLGYNDTDGDPFTGAWSVNPDYDANQLIMSGRVEAQLGAVLVTSITAYIDMNRTWSADTDASPMAILDFVTNDDVNQFSQEFRLSGSNSLITWMAGAVYSHDHVFTSYDGNLPALFNTTTFTSSDQSTDATALFGDIEWQLAPTLSLLTGLRHTWEQRRNVGGTTDLVSLPPASFLSMAPYGSPPVPLATIDAKITDSNWSGKIGLNWQPSAATLVYGSVTQGVKSGGFFAGVATNSAQLIPYKPEKLIAYEVGIKQRFSNQGLMFAGSLFYYDYQDVQTFIRDVVGNLPIQRLGNVDNATIYGADLDLTWAPVKGLDLNAGVGLLHTELGQFVSSGGIVPKGNRLPDAPEFTANLGGAYTFDLTQSLAGRVQVDARYTSFAYKDALNDPLIAADSWWLVNGRISLLGGDAWELALWAKNIFDERYVTQGINQLSLGNGFRVYGAPRTFGVSASYNFN